MVHIQGMERIKAKNGYSTIGFLTNDLTDSRTFAVWSGIINVVEGQGCNLICFPAGRLDAVSHTQGNQRTILCDMIKPEHLEGLITFQWWSHREWFEEVYHDYRPLPVVTIMRHYEGYPGVLLDPYDDMRLELRHLITVHGHRRIVFIRGPEGHSTAEARYRAYVETLAEHELPFDPQLVKIAAPYTESFLHGNPGEKAIWELLDGRGLEPGKDFDVIVAFNDEVAFGVLGSLQRRSIRVPSEVAVVGFDNREEADFTLPPLTTMAIPWYEMGQKAAEMVLMQMEGKKCEPEREILPARLIVRRSCGCTDPRVQQAAIDFEPEIQETARVTFSKKRRQIITELEQEIQRVLDDHVEWIVRLFDAFIAEVITEAPTSSLPNRFLTILEEGLFRMKGIDRVEDKGHNLLSILRRNFLGTLSADDRKLRYAENLWHQGRVLVSKIAQQLQMHRQVETERQMAIVHEIGQRLLHTFDMASSMDRLAQDLPQLDIPGCYLSLYEAPQPYQYPQPVPEWSHLILAYNQKGRITLALGHIRFLSCHLIPEGILSQEAPHNLVVQPLYSWEEQIGFVIFEVGSQHGKIYEALRAEFSYVLKATLFLQERQQTEETLKQSLETLQLAQDQLVQSEKMAALGGLVAGVAHEINTPLGIGVTAASYFEEKTQQIKAKYERREMTRSAFENYLQAAEQSAIMILSNLQRAAEHIRSFKQISIDQTTEGKRRFSLKVNIDDLLLSLQPELKKAYCTITVDCPDTIELHSYPGAFSQIITNLVLNSLLHGFENHIRGEILLQAAVNNGKLHITYYDNGTGMSEEELSRIFEPFYTTKRGQGGSGLGLYIVYNLVTQRLGGTITCESALNEGTTFLIQLPVEE